MNWHTYSLTSHLDTSMHILGIILVAIPALLLHFLAILLQAVATLAAAAIAIPFGLLLFIYALITERNK